MKRLFLLLLIPAVCFAQGTPVRHLTGSGVPSGTVASLEGSEYIDTSVNPPVLYVCSSVSVAAGPSPPAGTQTCNWTQVGSGGGALTSVPGIPGITAIPAILQSQLVSAAAGGCNWVRLQ